MSKVRLHSLYLDPRGNIVIPLKHVPNTHIKRIYVYDMEFKKNILYTLEFMESNFFTLISE